MDDLIKRFPKFHGDGRAHHFPGSTILSHLDQQGPDAGYFNALLDIYRAAPQWPFLRKLAMLPPSSYHVTIFDLVNERARAQGRWPRDVAPAASLEACNRFLAEKLSAFRMEADPPFRLRVEIAAPTGAETVFAIALAPADEAERARLRGLRDALAATVGLRARNHDAYVFHSTIAYVVGEMSGDERAAFSAALAHWRARIAAACPQIVLGAPEFCTFRDMFAFDRQFFLS
jgi:hypothetical protein